MDDGICRMHLIMEQQRVKIAGLRAAELSVIDFVLHPAHRERGWNDAREFSSAKLGLKPMLQFFHVQQHRAHGFLPRQRGKGLLHLIARHFAAITRTSALLLDPFAVEPGLEIG